MNLYRSSMSFLLLLAVLCLSAQTISAAGASERVSVEKVLDDLNTYAAKADFSNYFYLFAEESVFVGTDAGEVWNKREFMAYAKPHFDKGKAWNFRSVKRNVYFSGDKTLAWFDEILDTQMKLCRGSGVLQKIDGVWKIRQYVLSMTIPNAVSGEVIKIKSLLEDQELQKLKLHNVSNSK